MTAIAASWQPVSRTPPKEGRLVLEMALAAELTLSPKTQPRIGSACVDGKACAIRCVQLADDPSPQRGSTMLTQVVIEVAQYRGERGQFDPGRLCPVAEDAKRRVACRIAVARDVEAMQARRKQDGGKVGGRSGGSHWQVRQNLAQRKQSLDAFTRGHDILALTEPHGVAEDIPHCPSR